jgi:arginase
LAVKINRQANKIVLIGAPSSAGAHGPGVERAPEALRTAGLVERLREIGYEVTDLGDCPLVVWQQDDEHPRARNAAGVVTTLEALKPRVEQAVKSGALVLVLGGECTLALGTIAGVKRYFRSVQLVWCDRDADLNIPATSPSGCLHGMAVAHIVGRGAPELVRFWGEPPLVRPPEITLFGLERLDAPERELLEQLPMRKHTAADVQQKGAAAAARGVAGRIPESSQIVLHLDVDVIASEDFSASDVPGEGGLRLADLRQALEAFALQKNLAVLELAEFNPERDADGAGAKALVELLAGALKARYDALVVSEQPAAEAPAAEPASGEAAPVAPAPAVSAEKEAAADMVAEGGPTIPEAVPGALPEAAAVTAAESVTEAPPEETAAEEATAEPAADTPVDETAAEEPPQRAE